MGLDRKIDNMNERKPHTITDNWRPLIYFSLITNMKRYSFPYNGPINSFIVRLETSFFLSVSQRTNFFKKIKQIQ